MALTPNDTMRVHLLNDQSRRVLDAGGDTHHGGVIQQWTFHGGDNQQWDLVPDGRGYFRIIVRSSGKCLEVADARKDDGARVQQADPQRLPFLSNRQLWRMVQLESGTYRIEAKHSGKCLDAAAEHDGAVVHQWTWHGGRNQQWRILVDRAYA